MRPTAPADYDFLVAEFAAREGKLLEARDAYARAAEKDPGSAHLQRRVAVLSAQLEQIEPAVAAALRAVELEPDYEPGRLLLARLERMRRNVPGAERALLDEDGAPATLAAGLLLVQIYAENEQPARAVEVAEGLVEIHPTQLEPYFALAAAYDRSGDKRRVEETIERAIRQHPSQPTLYMRLAQLRRSSGDSDGEIAAYRRLLERVPGHYGTLASLGEAYLRIGDLESARTTYEQLAQLFPNNVAVIQRLAGIEVQLDDLASARALLEDALARMPEAGDIAYLLGLVRIEAGDLDAAIEALMAVPATHDQFADARLRIARILEQAGRNAEALSVLEELRVLSPDRQLDFHTAGMRVRTGDFAGGVALLEELIQANPDDYEALYQMGIVHDLASRDDEAIEWMRASLDKNPDNAHALNYIGYTWAERGENLDDAEALILRALEIEPEDGYITDSLGWLYYVRGRNLLAEGRGEIARGWLDRSREQLERAATLSGGDPVISEHLGDLHALLGEKRTALSFYEEAVRQDPRLDEQPDLYGKLEALRAELGSQ